MVAKCDEKVKEKRTTAIMHFKLHGAASLKSVAGADDESEVMGAKLRVSVWRVGISVSSRCQDSAALDSRFFKKGLLV